MSKPNFIIIAGSIGAGKTTLAYKLQSILKNAVVIENDTIRRELLGFPLNYFMNHETDNSFSNENNQRVDKEIELRTLQALSNNTSVIRCHAGRTLQDYKEYSHVYSQISNFKGIYLVAPEKTIRERLAKRKHERDTLSVLTLEMGHASDADENVLHHLPINNEVPENWLSIDATLEKTDVLNSALNYINQS